MERYELYLPNSDDQSFSTPITTASVKLGGQRDKRKTDSVPHLLYPKENIPQARMVREQLHLPRAIEEHIILYHPQKEKPSAICFPLFSS